MARRARVDDLVAGGQLANRLGEDFRRAVMDQESVDLCRDGPLDIAQAPAGAQDRTTAFREHGAQGPCDIDSVVAGKRGGEQYDVRLQCPCRRHDFVCALHGGD